MHLNKCVEMAIDKKDEAALPHYKIKYYVEHLLMHRQKTRTSQFVAI